MAKTNKQLREALQRKAAAGASLADLKASNAGKKLGKDVTKKIFSNWAPPAAAEPGPIYDDFLPTGTEGTIDDGLSPYGWDWKTKTDIAEITGKYGLAGQTVAANAAVSAAGIRGDADKEVARAYSDAQKYAATLGLEGVKYGADKESEWRQAIANIEVKGKLDLQPIINAGLERVAGIEAQAQRDVAETTGKYSLQSMKERTAADKSIGKMQLAGSMYGLLGSIFG